MGHADRAAGESKYSLWRLIKLQIDLITGFTSAPLRLAHARRHGDLGRPRWASVSSSAFAACSTARRPKGCSRCSRFSSCSWAANFLALGVLGEYVGRIYVEVRRRPRSVVEETINLGDAAAGMKVLFFGYSQIGVARARAAARARRRGGRRGHPSRRPAREPLVHDAGGSRARAWTSAVVYSEDLGAELARLRPRAAHPISCFSVMYRDMLPRGRARTPRGWRR